MTQPPASTPPAPADLAVDHDRLRAVAENGHCRDRADCQTVLDASREILALQAKLADAEREALASTPATAKEDGK